MFLGDVSQAVPQLSQQRAAGLLFRQRSVHDRGCQMLLQMPYRSQVTLTAVDTQIPEAVKWGAVGNWRGLPKATTMLALNDGDALL